MADSPSTPNPSDPNRQCACGSGQSFGLCCEPILTGRTPAPTAEALMRARFTAHVLGDHKFLHDSYLPTSSQPYTPEPETPPVPWNKLVIHSHEIGPSPDLASVDF